MAIRAMFWQGCWKPTKAGLTPVVATELEFYLIDPVRSALDPVRPPHSREGRWHTGQTQVLSISELQDFEDVFHDIATACRAQGVLADTTLRENGPGQYEINLNHVPDALRAADFAVFLKRIVKGVARRHDLDATFMAKPYGLQAGNGMHVHFLFSIVTAGISTPAKTAHRTR